VVRSQSPKEHKLVPMRQAAWLEVFILRSRLDRSTLIRDQLDDGAAQVQVHEVERHTEA
jgi:hypothetical protein